GARRQAASLPLTPTPEPASTHGDVSAEPELVASEASANSVSKNHDQTALSSVPVDTSKADANVNFSRFANLSQPALPDMGALMAALSSLDGQVMALQEQFNTTQEAMRNHDAEVAQTANQLRIGIHRVAERMDNTIADVAR